MAYRKVRIYSGGDSETDVIGFGVYDTTAPEDPRFAEFMEARGYECKRIDKERVPYSVSIRHVQVRPPFTEDHLGELATLCAGDTVEGEYSPGIIEPNRDGVLVIDNRHELPDEVLDMGTGNLIGGYIAWLLQEG